MKMKVGHYMMVKEVEQYLMDQGLNEVLELTVDLPQIQAADGNMYFTSKALNEIMAYVDFREMECEVSTLMIVK